MSSHRDTLSGCRTFGLHRFFSILAITLLATLTYLSASAQNTLPEAEQAKVDAIVQQVLQQTGVPSASVGVVTNGKIAFLKAYGKARLQPPVEATPDMRYCIGSVSKQFTAAAVLILQQQGKLSLDDPVSKWLPQLTRANEVTLRELLSHTSGYEDYYAEDYSLIPMAHSITPDALMDDWAKRPLDFDPGTKWQYSNTNYVIAGKIVEMVSGMPLMTFLQQNIFNPLGMHDVMDGDVYPLTPTDARGYIRYALGPPRPAPKDGAGWMFGAGELAMPTDDLLLWDISLMNQSLLQPESYKEMFTEVNLKNGQGTHYGLGVGVSTVNGHLSISHGGEVSGFTTQNLVFPQDKLAIAVFTNQGASRAAGTIGTKMSALLLGLPADPAQQTTDQVRQIFLGFQQGKMDRSLFTANCNAYFNSQAIADYESSLRPLGAPLEFRLTSETHRGGMVHYMYDVVFPGKHVSVSVYLMPDGKIEQYLVIPVE